MVAEQWVGDSGEARVATEAKQGKGRRGRGRREEEGRLGKDWGWLEEIWNRSGMLDPT